MPFSLLCLIILGGSLPFFLYFSNLIHVLRPLHINSIFTPCQAPSPLVVQLLNLWQYSWEKQHNCLQQPYRTLLNVCVFYNFINTIRMLLKKNYSNWIRTKNSEWNQSIGISTFFEFARLILLIVLFCFLSLRVRFLKAMSKHLEK